MGTVVKSKTILIISILLVASVCLNVYQCTHKTPMEVKTKTKIEYRTRTVKSPVATSTKDVGQIPVAVKIVSHTEKDTICDTVYLPRKQTEYRDSDYTAYVSGYEAKMDSISVRTKIITNTNTVVKTKYRRINIGITGGYGYGINSKTFEPFIGVGVTYNLYK